MTTHKNKARHWCLFINGGQHDLSTCLSTFSFI